MSHITKIYFFRVNSISGNGFISFGNTISKGSKADSKSVGETSEIGDVFEFTFFPKNINSEQNNEDNNGGSSGNGNNNNNENNESEFGSINYNRYRLDRKRKERMGTRRKKKRM